MRKVKRNLAFILILLTMGFSSYSFSEEVNTSSDENILEVFFRSLLRDTTAGYVLFGDRPVFVYSLPNDVSLIPGTEEHKRAIEKWAGLAIWNSISNASCNYIIKTAALDNVNSEGEFLLINKSAFITAVLKNLPLFRLRMGIRTTPENLLLELLDPKKNIASLFQGQHTLLGIIFGYGTENGIVYERGAAIIKSGEPQLFFPYQTGFLPQNEEEMIEGLLCSKIAPGIGFSTIEEEIKEISLLSHPTANLDGTSTKIPFTYIKENKESTNILEAYKNYQQTLDKVLADQDFLDIVLARFNVKNQIKKDAPIKISSELLARSIWQMYLSIYPEENVDLENFTTGMEVAEENSTLEKFDEVDVLDRIRERRARKYQRYDKSKKYLEEIARFEGIHCVKPCRIYFRIQQPHSSSKEVSQITKAISAYILVQDMEGRVLSGSPHLTPSQSFKLSEVISGLSYGIMGMKLGEIREIWIHPDYIYGIDSDFAEGAPVKVTLQLTEINNGSEQLAQLIPEDFRAFQKSNESWQSLVKKYMTYSGYRAWAYIKNAPESHLLKDITFLLRKFREQPHLAIPLNQQERFQMIRFYWQLYFPGDFVVGYPFCSHSSSPS